MDKSFLSIALSIKDIKKTEAVLPIAKLSAIVTPFLLGDHQALKTAVLSPQNYDREITKTLYKHTQLLDPEGNEIKLKYEELISKISNIDRTWLLWACYNSTYESLGVREVSCSKCGAKSKYKITLNEIVQQDSMNLWDEEIHFSEYTYPIEISNSEYTYVFETSIPTIQKYNQILNTISIDKIRKNLESNSVLSSSEELAVLTRSIAIRKGDVELTKTNNYQEILTSFDAAIPTNISEDFRYQYRLKFEKYIPKFYTFLSCPECKNDTKYDVDLESEFFRRVLYGRESTGEEL